MGLGILGLSWVYIGILKNKLATTTIQGLGFRVQGLGWVLPPPCNSLY